jgi:hypothetical protein
MAARNRSHRVAVLLRAAAAASLGCGCGGGAATLHPAHTLPASRMTAGAGVSGQFAFGEASDAVENAGTVSASGSADQEQQLAFAGAIANSAVAPGLAPWIGARVGLGGHNEAGVTYTGRSARADARHSFEDGSVALSLGAGASAILGHLESSATAEHSATSLHKKEGAFSWGFDVPVIVGWRSSASVVQAWGGIRGGYERLNGTLPLATPPDYPILGADVRADHVYGGGLVGFAIGLPPLWVAVQLDAAYHGASARGSFPQAGADPESPGATVSREVDVSGVSLAPTGAVLGKF